jgi:RNA polymerase sigma-70 factor (ECF subfamily)
MDEMRLNALLARDLDTHFEALVVHFQDRLYRFALRLSGNAQDAEEIAQDAFIRAYRALKSYPAERVRAMALRPWLYQIALNVWKNRMRRKRLPRAELDAEIVSPADGPERQAEAAMRGEEIMSALDGLPDRLRTAVVLRHIEGLSYAEIATVLDQPVGTVKSNVHRGLGALREARGLEVWT